MQLDRDRILSTALELLNSYGLADVTMRRVSTALGVAPGALYWHVANKQALIAAMAEKILAPVSGTSPLDVAKSLHSALLSWRDGAEVASAGLAYPDSGAWEVLTEKIAASFKSVEGHCALEAEVQAASLAIAHLVLGATQMEQSRQQLAESAKATASADAADKSPVDHRPDIHRGVEIIVNGLRNPLAGTEH